MVDGRQYHMNANRDRLLQNALKQVAAEQQRNPEVSSRDYRDPRFANRPMQPAPVPQEPYAGWLGDLVGAIKDIRVPEGPKIPGARTPLNPGGTLGGGVNMLKDMLISSGEDFGAQGTQKNTPIPMGGIAAAGLLPFKSLTKIARSLRGADDAAKAASRTRGMQDADDVIASRARAKQAATDYSPLPSKKPGAGLPKTVDDIFGDVTPSTSSSKKYMTEDGSVFVQKADGTLTDGDTVFNSLDDLLDKTGGNIRRHTDAVKNPLDVEPQWANDLDLEPQWGDNLASAEPVAQTSKGTPGLQRENILGPDGKPRLKMSESTGNLVSDRPLLKMDPATRGTSPATPQTQPKQTRTPIRMNPPDETLKANQKAYKDKIQRDKTQIGDGGKEFPPTTSVAKQEAMDRFSRLEFDMSPADSIFVTNRARVHPTVIKNANREIVVVEMQNGLRMPFYKRTGTGTEAQIGVHEAGDWKPFFGLKESDKARNQAGLGRGWFMKHPSHESLHKGDVFERELHDIGKSLKNLFEQGNLKVDPRFDFDNQLGSIVNQVNVSEEIEIINTLLGSNGLMNGPEGYYALRKKFS